MRDTQGDEFTDRLLAAINSMKVGVMAAIGRRDYEQRSERPAQGLQNAKLDGKYQGRPIDESLRNHIKEHLGAGLGIRTTARNANCSTPTVLRIR